jgi:dipeptidyl aminopeptidase/acylaminoacyl peptidase
MSNTPGEWPSPLTAQLLTQASTRLGWTQVVDGDLWWDESRPNESGRVAVVSESRGDLISASWNASTAVHEYGGLAWLGHTRNGKTYLTFANMSDQRVYSSEVGMEPQPLTPDTEGNHRYIEFIAVDDEIWCIREKHAVGHAVTRDLIAISDSGIRSLESTSHFYCNPRISPDGKHFCWIAWEHPQMPWDGTELRVADVVNGELINVRTLTGSSALSVLGPEWADDRTIYYISEETGWWNPWKIDLVGEVDQIIDEETEWAGPLWMLGRRFIQILDNGKFVALHGQVDNLKLAVVDPKTKSYQDVSSNLNAFNPTFSVHGNHAYAVGGGSTLPQVLVDIDLTHLEVTRHIYQTKVPFDISYLTEPRQITVPGKDGRLVHAILHPAHNPEVNFSGPTPLLVTAHGGPTSNATAVVNLQYNYFTSRGITVVDVNYGGSTGYGRQYRQALNGNWGIIDREDVISVVLALIDQGVASKDQILIRGGSAGGFTVLNVLVNSDVFAAGASYFGVSDCSALATDTHDFESRYLDSMIGPYPERKDLYDERSPLNHADNLSSPLILFQGLDDKVVLPEQSRAFRDVCVRKGIKHKLFEFEGEGHGFRKAETIITCAENEIGFYGEVLGFTPIL